MTAEPVDRAVPLTRDTVVDVGVDLVRADGLGSLTMRAVAAELGVTPMALYHHVANKDELVRHILRRVLDETAPLEIGEEGWEASLREHLLSRWRAFRAHPGLAGFLVEHPTAVATPGVRREGTQFFVDVGFSPEIAELAWSFALTYIHGRLSAEARIDPDAARQAGLDFRTPREHVEFGVDAVIIALRELLADPGLCSRYSLDRAASARADET